MQKVAREAALPWRRWQPPDKSMLRFYFPDKSFIYRAKPGYYGAHGELANLVLKEAAMRVVKEKKKVGTLQNPRGKRKKKMNKLDALTL